MSNATDSTPVVVGPCSCGGYGIVHNEEAQKATGVCHGPARAVPRATRPPAELPGDLEIEVIQGMGGLCVAINGYRVAGAKPWGGGRTLHSWRVKLDDIPALHVPTSRVDRDMLHTAYESGYTRGHNDTAEGCVVHSAVAADEYLDLFPAFREGADRCPYCKVRPAEPGGVDCEDCARGDGRDTHATR